MSDRVNTTMDDVERAMPDSPFDHVRGHPKPKELPPRDYPVLPGRQPRHRSVDLPGVLGRLNRPNSPHVFHDADAAGEMRTGGAHFVEKGAPARRYRL
jgi:hypothetical protein